MAKKPLVITSATLLALVGVALLIYFRFGTNNPSTIESALVTEEYDGSECKFRIYEPAQASFITPVPNIQKQILCNFTIRQDLPPYIFRIVGVRDQNEIERVEIYPETNPESIQRFSGFMTYPLVERVFEAQDINFDGYLDVGTVAWYGTAGFLGFQYWIFDPVEKNFSIDKQFATLSNPTILPEKKQIFADDPVEGRVIYEWQNGVLTKL